MATAQDRPAPPQYRIIYNWDGAPHAYSEYPQSVDQFLDKTFAPLTGTQVDALFWSLGEHEATWPSEALGMIGDATDRVYNGVAELRRVEGIRAMFERGENPYEAMVSYGHERDIDVWASIRMNDQHFWRIQDLETMQRTVTNGLTDLRKQHPEWCLGDDAPNWCTTSWNMAIPEVREHKLQFIEEACRVADWDGVELDWQRHAFHLPANHEYRLRYTLTDLQAAIRQITDRLSEERGKPFHVAVRVATTLESCRRIGYDIPVWMGTGLCDIVIGGGNSGTDACFETAQFLELAHGTNIRVYPGYDSDGRQQTNRLVSGNEWRDRWFAAMSQTHLDRGADGAYVFNWHANETTRRRSLTTMGTKETLRHEDKSYTALHRDIANSPLREDCDRDDRINGEVPVTLFRSLTGEGPTFHIPIHDDIAAEAGNLAGIQLLIEMEHFSPAVDEVTVTLDGLALPAPAIRNAAAENDGNPADVDENSWLVWDLEHAQAAKGEHEISVVLANRDPRIRVPLTIGNVEFCILYRRDQA